MFSGKILNNTSDSISIYKDNNMIYESVVDVDGLFNITIDTITSGLYTFYHEPEFQYIIIDENDNLQIRLNTLDFDESLVYTGKGSSKNNFLMDVFLRSENDELDINSKLDLAFDTFKNLVDSLYNKQMNSFKLFKENNILSNSSKEIINTAILYPYISKFHSYIIRNNIEEEIQKDLFINYQNEISYDLDALAYFKPYIDFLYLHIYNNVKIKKDYENSLDFNIQRLLYTDKIIKSKLVKSRVLRFHAFGFILQRQDDVKNKTFLKAFFEISKDKKVNEEINNLYNELKD
ncbi:MAG: hypothetical protein CMC06_00730 [Flavobacteriaceae bacterium]|nr:hypothetical protein [Flavobacteriaceae bacterium]